MIRQTWSVNRLSAELGIDRRTLAKRLEGLKPATEKHTARGIDREWYLSAVVEHLYRPTEGERLDPQHEKARLDAARADLAETQLGKVRGELIPAVEYERALSDGFKTVAMTLESLPDLLERDAGLPGPAVDRAIQVIDRLREDLYRRLTGIEA